MESIWTAIIVAVVTSTISPVILLMLKNRSDRQQRLDDAEFKRQERLATEAREDAREARTQAQASLVLSGINTVKKQTDGVMSQVAALAKATGNIEGEQRATVKAQDTATTLELGRQQGRDAERESVAAKSSLSDIVAQPLPVVDERAALINERVALATELGAEAAVRSANAAEEREKE